MTINWLWFKRKCPECGNTEIEKLNEYRFSIEKKGEQRKYRCLMCNYEWWS